MMQPAPAPKTMFTSVPRAGGRERVGTNISRTKSDPAHLGAKVILPTWVAGHRWGGSLADRYTNLVNF